MKAGKFKLLGILLIVLTLMGGCTTTQPVTTQTETNPLASLYNPSRLSLHPEYSIYHENDDFSSLFVRAYPSELLFNQANENSEYRALFSLKYRLIMLDEPGEEDVIVDSSSVTYKLLAQDENKAAFFASLSIPIPSGGRYLLRLQSTDLNRGSIGLEYIYVDKTNVFNGQNFKIISQQSGFPKFMRFFKPGEQFSVQYRDPSVDSLYVDYFSFSSELPRPPITASGDYTLNLTPDTSFSVPLADTAFYGLRRGGMYFVRVNRDNEHGLSLFNFGESFPDVKTPGELMEPLFYLTTMAEYRDLRMESNRKLAVDNFWLNVGNSVERSRELIRIYYNRVIYSNLYFTANKEGWKTDQGMIFILFGPPSRIRMTGNGESWYYFVRRRSNPVEFRFKRQPDAFANQNLVWEKTTDSQMFWNEAVKTWRNGKVFSPAS